MKLLFAGTPDFAAGYLEALMATRHELLAVITQPDRPGKRGKKLMPSPVKQVAEAAGLPVLQPAKLTVDDLADYAADLMIVVAYGQILRPPVLRAPRLGCVNVHASLLPRWRGAAPVQRAILAGDQQTGVTLMQMDKGLDTGDMLTSVTVPIAPGDTTGSLFNKLAETGHPLLLALLEDLEAGRVTAVSQDDDAATYASKLEKEEARLEWSNAAGFIDRQVRAFQPEPVAFCFLGDMRIRVHKGQVISSSAVGEPGGIVEVSKKGVLVECGESRYLIERIQLPVGKGAVLSGSDVLNGWTDVISPGARLS